MDPKLFWNQSARIELILVVLGLLASIESFNICDQDMPLCSASPRFETQWRSSLAPPNGISLLSSASEASTSQSGPGTHSSTNYGNLKLDRY